MAGVPALALFDLDNTLVDRQAAHRRWAESFAARYGLGEKGVAWLCEADNDGFARREVVFAGVRERFGLAEPVANLVGTYRDEYPTFFAPDPQVSEALVRLRHGGWRIGVVTNGPASQHVKMERAGLAGLVDACCVSDEVGVAKPDRQIFEEAIERCGGRPGDPGRAWMVGDAPGPDIGGARGVGLSTVWLHRGRRWTEPGYRPDVVVATVAQAVAVLLAD
jgi:HAD superfamily hydrolase (TIGR01549 family)